ncbi:hypothetical protein ACW5UC_24570, partial [Priestia aryabhattai]|uniref:hypothetical protein n=1 Tax=Priestia megaterium TaxID=1404 RepID=UPI003F9E38C1
VLSNKINLLLGVEIEMKMNLPSRKEMNLDIMRQLISEIAEHEQGDGQIIGELFESIFNDLSVTNQEKYLKVLKSRLGKYTK